MRRGVDAILCAFFNAEKRLDREAMRHQFALCLKAGVAGMAVLGLQPRWPS